MDVKNILTGLFDRLSGLRAERPTAGTKFRLMGMVADIAEVAQTLQQEVLLRVSQEATLDVDYLKSLGLDIAEDVVEDVDKVAATTACLFFGYFDGATTISESCGGGGGNNELPKKKDNEDELFFALRCHQMAKTMHAPKYRLRR